MAAVAAAAVVGLHALAESEAFGSRPLGNAFVLAAVPPPTVDPDPVATLGRVADELGVDLAHVEADPWAPETVTHVYPLRGAVEQPVTPWLSHVVHPGADLGGRELRGSYTTDATGADYTRLLGCLDGAGFAPQDARQSLAGTVPAVLRSRPVALVAVGVAVLLLATAARQGHRRRASTALRTVVGWPSWRSRGRDLAPVAVLTGAVLLVATGVVLGAWVVVADHRRPEVVLPLWSALAAVTTAGVLAVHLLALPAAAPRRLVATTVGRLDTLRREALPIALHAGLVLVVVAGVGVATTALDATRQVERTVAADPDASRWWSMWVGVAGSTEEEFPRQLGPIARHHLATGHARLADPTIVPGTVLHLAPPSTTAGTDPDTPLVRVDARPVDRESARAELDLVLDTHWAVDGQAGPPRRYVFRDPPRDEPPVSPVTSGPFGIDVPVRVEAELPLDLVPDEMLAVSAFNGWIGFDDPRAVERDLARAGVGGLVSAWKNVSDDQQEVLRASRRETLLAVVVASTTGLVLVLGTVTTALATAARRRPLADALTLAGRRPGRASTADLAVGAALTATAALVAVAVVPAGFVVSPLAPAAAALLVLGLAATDLTTRFATLSWTRRAWARRPRLLTPREDE